MRWMTKRRAEAAAQIAAEQQAKEQAALVALEQELRWVTTLPTEQLTQLAREWVVSVKRANLKTNNLFASDTNFNINELRRKVLRVDRVVLSSAEKRSFHAVVREEIPKAINTFSVRTVGNLFQTSQAFSSELLRLIAAVDKLPVTFQGEVFDLQVAQGVTPKTSEYAVATLNRASELYLDAAVLPSAEDRFFVEQALHTHIPDLLNSENRLKKLTEEEQEQVDQIVEKQLNLINAEFDRIQSSVHSHVITGMDAKLKFLEAKLTHLQPELGTKLPHQHPGLTVAHSDLDDDYGYGDTVEYG